MMPGFGWNGCCGFGSFGWIGWIVNLVLTLGIIVSLVLLVVWGVRRITNSNQGAMFSTGQSRGLTTAQEILQERYVRGEITREEYHQMLEDIR